MAILAATAETTETAMGPKRYHKINGGEEDCTNRGHYNEKEAREGRKRGHEGECQKLDLQVMPVGIRGKTESRREGYSGREYGEKQQEKEGGQSYVEEEGMRRNVRETRREDKRGCCLDQESSNGVKGGRDEERVDEDFGVGMGRDKKRKREGGDDRRKEKKRGEGVKGGRGRDVDGGNEACFGPEYEEILLPSAGEGRDEFGVDVSAARNEVRRHVRSSQESSRQ